MATSGSKKVRVSIRCYSYQISDSHLASLDAAQGMDLVRWMMMTPYH